MKNLINRLRINNVYYLLSLFFTIIFVIVGMVFTEDYEWGRHLIMVGMFFMLYLVYFLGVNPILKGFGLTLIPFVIGLSFSIAVEHFVPDELYQKWFGSHNTRGGSIDSAFFFIVLIIVSKVSKVKPFIMKLEKKEDGNLH